MRFKILLYLFLFVMGTRVARRLSEIREKGLNLILFALVTPLIGSILALLASNLFSLTVGNATLLMVLYLLAVTDLVNFSIFDGMFYVISILLVISVAAAIFLIASFVLGIRPKDLYQ